MPGSFDPATHAEAMVKKCRQQHYIAKTRRQWQKKLKAYRYTGDEEALHSLRLALKKLRALASLSAACSGGKATKDVHFMRKMFRHAGAVRDAVSELQLLEHFRTVADEHIRKQEQVRSEAGETFSLHLRQYRKDGRKAFDKLFDDVRAIRPSLVHRWYAQQFISISALLNASGDRFHKARKLIKEVLYVLDVLPHRLAAAIRLNKEYLQDLEQAIGAWHDASMVVLDWVGKDLPTSHAMVKECREKEAAARRLGGEFYRLVHLS